MDTIQTKDIKDNMNVANKKAAVISETKGVKEFIKHVFTTEDGKKLTYAEMRDLYG